MRLRVVVTLVLVGLALAKEPSMRLRRDDEHSVSTPSESTSSESTSSESTSSESMPSETTSSESKPSESMPSESKPSESIIVKDSSLSKNLESEMHNDHGSEKALRHSSYDHPYPTPYDNHKPYDYQKPYDNYKPYDDHKKYDDYKPYDNHKPYYNYKPYNHHKKRDANKFAENSPNFNGTKCVYNSQFKVVTCRGFNDEVECDAFGNFTGLGTKKFDVYGIGKLPENYNYSKLESVKYFLYPRNFDNQTYFNYSIPEGGNVVNLYMYYAENFVDYGIRISNFKCFEKMVNMLKTSGFSVFKVENGSTVSEVSLYGEILYFDRNLQKRWWYGLGFSPYMWYPYSFGWNYMFGK